MLLNWILTCQIKLLIGSVFLGTLSNFGEVLGMVFGEYHPWLHSYCVQHYPGLDVGKLFNLCHILFQLSVLDQEHFALQGVEFFDVPQCLHILYQTGLVIRGYFPLSQFAYPQNRLPRLLLDKRETALVQTIAYIDLESLDLFQMLRTNSLLTPNVTLLVLVRHVKDYFIEQVVFQVRFLIQSGRHSDLSLLEGFQSHHPGDYNPVGWMR